MEGFGIPVGAAVRSRLAAGGGERGRHPDVAAPPTGYSRSLDERDRGRDGADRRASGRR